MIWRCRKKQSNEEQTSATQLPKFQRPESKEFIYQDIEVPRLERDMEITEHAHVVCHNKLPSFMEGCKMGFLDIFRHILITFIVCSI